MRELRSDDDAGRRTTVEVLFGQQEGALPGPNPRYHGRPSYHPLLARVAQTDTVIGARLRPGDMLGCKVQPNRLPGVSGGRSNGGLHAGAEFRGALSDSR